MTLVRNFGGRRFVRRLSAKERLIIHIKNMKNLLENGNGMNFNPEKLSSDINVAEKELVILESRTQGSPHKIFTKKVGSNTGRMKF